MNDAPFTLTDVLTGETITPEKVPLPPLSEVDQDPYDETTMTTLAPPHKCPHDALKLISSVEVRCTKCSAGWTGPGVYQLFLQTCLSK